LRFDERFRPVLFFAFPGRRVWLFFFPVDFEWSGLSPPRKGPVSLFPAWFLVPGNAAIFSWCCRGYFQPCAGCFRKFPPLLDRSYPLLHFPPYSSQSFESFKSSVRDGSVALFFARHGVVVSSVVMLDKVSSLPFCQVKGFLPSLLSCWRSRSGGSKTNLLLLLQRWASFFPSTLIEFLFSKAEIARFFFPQEFSSPRLESRPAMFSAVGWEISCTFPCTFFSHSPGGARRDPELFLFSCQRNGTW